jgi:hypothetical protein
MVAGNANIVSLTASTNNFTPFDFTQIASWWDLERAGTHRGVQAVETWT